MKNTNSSVSKWVSDFVRDKVEKEDEKLKLLEENKVLNKTNELLRTEMVTVMRFKVPCSVCGKDIVATSLDETWDSYVYPKLKKAFNKAVHISC